MKFEHLVLGIHGGGSWVDQPVVIDERKGATDSWGPAYGIARVMALVVRRTPGVSSIKPCSVT